jgi:hypothetical protein
MPQVTRALYRALTRLRPASAGGRDLDADRRLLAACERAVAQVAADPGCAGQVGRTLFAEVRHDVHPARQLDAYDVIEAALDAVRRAPAEARVAEARAA